MKLTDEQLNELAKKSERATPGKRIHIGTIIGVDGTTLCIMPNEEQDIDFDEQTKNAEHIAAFDRATCLALIRELQAAREALSEYQRFNRIRNDLDAYLNAMGAWALVGEGDKPEMKSYGLDL